MSFLPLSSGKNDLSLARNGREKWKSEENLGIWTFFARFCDGRCNVGKALPWEKWNMFLLLSYAPNVDLKQVLRCSMSKLTDVGSRCLGVAQSEAELEYDLDGIDLPSLSQICEPGEHNPGPCFKLCLDHWGPPCGSSKVCLYRLWEILRHFGRRLRCGIQTAGWNWGNDMQVWGELSDPASGPKFEPKIAKVWLEMKTWENVASEFVCACSDLESMVKKIERGAAGCRVLEDYFRLGFTTPGLATEMDKCGLKVEFKSSGAKPGVGKWPLLIASRGHPALFVFFCVYGCTPFLCVPRNLERKRKI